MQQNHKHYEIDEGYIKNRIQRSPCTVEVQDVFLDSLRLLVSFQHAEDVEKSNNSL